MREDQERRRNFGGLDENQYNARKLSTTNPPPPPIIEGSEVFSLHLNSARNSISSNRRDVYKNRLLTGIQTAYMPERDKNFLRPI